MKTVGILGGFGPETTAEFYMSIINKSRKSGNAYPSILIHNVPVPFGLERDAVRDGKNADKFLPLLLDGLKAIDDKSDFIVLPCNTLHIFIEELRDASSVPVINIFEELADEIKSRGLKKVGLMATSTTFKSGVLELELAKSGIEVIKPDTQCQGRLSEIIFLILQGNKSDKIRDELFSIARSLKSKGAEAVVLGCTDLQLLLKQPEELELIDTADVLADSVVARLNGVK